MREGFEAVYLSADRVEGTSVGVEDGAAWWVAYELGLDGEGRTRSARLTGRSARGSSAVELEADGEGRWLVDGAPASWLAGCRDVDLEASAFTNALAVRRLGLAVGEGAEAPAAWVRTVGLEVERLEQRYERVEDDAGRMRFDYAAPELGFAARLVHDAAGLGLDYPGLAVRAG